MQDYSNITQKQKFLNILHFLGGFFLMENLVPNLNSILLFFFAYLSTEHDKINHVVEGSSIQRNKKDECSLDTYNKVNLDYNYWRINI